MPVLRCWHCCLLAACVQPKPLPVLGQVPEFPAHRADRPALRQQVARRPHLGGRLHLHHLRRALPDDELRRCARCRRRPPRCPTCKLVSFTVDPAHDTPPVLAEYAKHFKPEPGALVLPHRRAGEAQRPRRCNGFKLNGVDGSLTHSTRFVLVDRQRPHPRLLHHRRGRLHAEADARHPATGARTIMTPDPALRQRRAERHRRRAAGLGLHADPPQAHPDAPQGDDRGLRDVVPVPGLLPGLSRAGGLGAVSRRPARSARSISASWPPTPCWPRPCRCWRSSRCAAAWRRRYDKHRRIARWTLPIWLYVSVTGVVVYLMLYHL